LVPREGLHAPLQPGDYPELTTSYLLGVHEASLYMSMIGDMQWAVALGMMDIFAATMTLSRLRTVACEGHLGRLKRVHEFS